MVSLSTNNPKIFFLTAGLGKEKYKLAARRLLQQAVNLKIFSSYLNIDEFFIEEIYKNYSEIYESDKIKGYGYWAWKVISISYIFEKMNNGDLLLYMDGGCEILNTRQSQKKFLDYIGNAQKEGITCFSTGHLEKLYTSPHVLKYFNLQNSSELLLTEQISASILLICKNKKTKLIIDEWYKSIHFRDKYLLRDDISDFTHRHDQSLLSIICKKNLVTPVANNSYYPDNYYLYSDTAYESPFHTIRNQSNVSLISLFRFFKNPVFKFFPKLSLLFSKILRKLHTLAFINEK